MNKGSKSTAVFLELRDSITNKRFNWDGLVDDVFKEEVDQLVIEDGVRNLHIRQKQNSMNKSHTLNSSCAKKEQSSSSIK